MERSIVVKNVLVKQIKKIVNNPFIEQFIFEKYSPKSVNIWYCYFVTGNIKKSNEKDQ